MRKLTKKDGINVIGRCNDQVRSVLEWEELPASARKTLSDVTHDLTKALEVIAENDSPFQQARYRTKNLDVKISGAIWTCLNLHLKQKPYKSRSVWTRYLVPLDYPDMEIFVETLEKHFRRGMTWANRRKAWHLMRPNPSVDRVYSGVRDNECRLSWAWETLRPYFPDEARNISQRGRGASRELLDVGRTEDLSHLTQQPLEMAY